MKIKSCFCILIVFLSFPIFILPRPSSTYYSDEYLVLPSPGEKSGLFSVFTTVLGFLEFYDQKKCAGIKIDFSDKSIYYDPSRGSNWWGYYFETEEFEIVPDAVVRDVPRKLKRAFTRKGYAGITRHEAFSLIQKYIKIKPQIEAKINFFAREYFGNSNVIGVHYRGTDKRSEAPRVPYKKVYETIQTVINSLSSDDYKIFVATDEKAFLDDILVRFPGRVIYTNSLRSSDGAPVHKETYKNCYKMGEDAVLDCLLLSKCGILIRTASNLSTCAGYFNPGLPIIDLNFLYVERRKAEW
jgi:hypothetical protein